MVKCEKCGSVNTLEIALFGGEFLSACAEVQRRKMLPKFSPVVARACTDCGAVFGLYLKNPEKLAPFAGYNGNG